MRQSQCLAPLRKRRPRHWKVYESQVFKLFKEHFPHATVRRNVHVRGRYSRRKRQIDVLLIEQTPAGIVKTIIDTKLFKRKVDVKAVDALAGFVDDVGAQKGMLITACGHTGSALRRAFYGPADLELDILNFSALEMFQGLSAIPYAGDKGFVVSAPLGWVVDASRSEGRIAAMYQRGIDAPRAIAKKEFLYINFWDRKADPLNVEQLDELQVARLKESGAVVVSHRPTVVRPDARTRLRIADVKRYGCLEVIGFLEFNDVIFFAVLLTPHETQRSNIRRLESVLRQAVPIDVTRDNSSLIAELNKRLERASSPNERGSILRQIGHWYRDMGEFKKAQESLESALSLDPENAYWSIRELLPALAKLSDHGRATELMLSLLRLDPRNPTVFNDCFAFGAGWIERSTVLGIIETVRREHAADPMVQANCDYYSANLLACDDAAAARKLFIAARRQFSILLPSDHQVFRALRVALKRFPPS